MSDGIEAVIFDIGNVLIEWHPERYYDRTIGEDRRRALFAEVDLNGMNERVDLGEGFRDVIYGFAEDHPDWRAEIRDWYDNWLQLLAPVIPHSAHLLRALRRKGVRVFTLTNFGKESFDFAQTQFDFLNEFDREYVSGRLGVIKPDPRIYEMVEADCGLSGGRLLFADDRAENVAAAHARGWRTHLFTEPEGWADALVAHGLLTDDEAKS